MGLGIGLGWHVPLRIPAAYEMRLAAQPSRSARMHGMPPPTWLGLGLGLGLGWVGVGLGWVGVGLGLGMPPPTAASHPIFARLLSATEVSSAACTASIAWLAVTRETLGLG